MKGLDPQEPLAAIEDRLRRLEPAQPPADLMEKLVILGVGEHNIVRRPWRWVYFAAAASIAAAILLKTNWSCERGWNSQAQRPPAGRVAAPSLDERPEPLRIYAPVSTRNLLLGAQEIGVIEPEHAPPVRLIRCIWLDDATYRTAGEYPDLEVTRTREQIIPVALEVY